MLEENNSPDEGKWYRARQFIPNAIIHCRHGRATYCECVKCFEVDKFCPLSKRQAILEAASLELNKMKRLNIQNDQQHKLLMQITQCRQGEEGIFIEQYESIFNSLLPHANPVSPPINDDLQTILPNNDNLQTVPPSNDQKENDPYILPENRKRQHFNPMIFILLTVRIISLALHFW